MNQSQPHVIVLVVIVLEVDQVISPINQQPTRGILIHIKINTQVHHHNIWMLLVSQIMTFGTWVWAEGHGGLCQRHWISLLRKA